MNLNYVETSAVPYIPKVVDPISFIQSFSANNSSNHDQPSTSSNNVDNNNLDHIIASDNDQLEQQLPQPNNADHNELTFDEHDYYQRAPHNGEKSEEAILLEFVKDGHLMVGHNVEVSQSMPSPTKQPKVIMPLKFNKAPNPPPQQSHQQLHPPQQTSLLNLNKLKFVNNVKFQQQQKPPQQFAPIKFKLHSSTRKRNSASVSVTVDANTAVSGRNRNSASITEPTPTLTTNSISAFSTTMKPTSKPTKRQYKKKPVQNDPEKKDSEMSAIKPPLKSSSVSPLIATAFSASFSSIKLDKNNNRKLISTKQARTKKTLAAATITKSTAKKETKAKKNAKTLNSSKVLIKTQKRKYTRRKDLTSTVKAKETKVNSRELSDSNTNIIRGKSNQDESFPNATGNNDRTDIETNCSNQSSSSATFLTTTSESATNTGSSLNNRSLSNIPNLLQNTRRFHVLSPNNEHQSNSSEHPRPSPSPSPSSISNSSQSNATNAINSKSISNGKANATFIAAASTSTAPNSVSSTSLGIYRRNPFELIACHEFNPNEVPFYVKIKSDTLAIMDLHSHCLKTEVIGLLGGYYCRVTKTLHIETAEPCPSICNDSIRCEIDPVSQAIALEKVESQHYQVVGWYHSHPTFSPDPSLRDIETQTAYQQMFNQCSSSSGGGRPYVAFILSPFLKPDEKNISKRLNPSSSFQLFTPIKNVSSKKFYANDKLYDYANDVPYRYFTPELNSLLASPYKCFWVSQSSSNVYSNASTSSSSNNNLKVSLQAVPYQVKLELKRDECLIPAITKKLSPMCQWIARDYPGSVVNLFKTFIRIGSISVSYLEKIIASLSHHLQQNSTDFECERIRQECIGILVQEFKRDAIEYHHQDKKVTRP